MPGNKNSGRKKKVVEEHGETEAAPTPSKKKKVGRRKKMLMESTEEETSDARSTAEMEVTAELKSSSSGARSNASNFYDLKKRTSETSISYDSLLGPSLAMFPSSKLPHRRTVLQRYRYLITGDDNPTRSEVISIITNEIISLWEISSIPFRDIRSCRDCVKKCIECWINAKRDVRNSKTFQVSLDTLLDLRPASLNTLSTLKKKLVTFGTSGLVDYNFFKGQLSFPQTSSIDSRKDKVLHIKGKEKEQRRKKAAEHAERNKGDISATSPPANRDKTDIDEANVIIKSPRQIRKGESSVLVSENASSESELDNEWEPPLRFQRQLSKKAEHLTLKLPAKTLPRLLAGTSTSTKTSIRKELKLVATIIESGGGDLADVSLSATTIHRQRKEATTSRAAEVRKEIKKHKGMKERGDYFVAVHWDGKIIQIMTGETEDRLAIAISSPNLIQGQFLASPVIPDGTGLAMANCVYQIIGEYELLSDVQALVFDTTASNTGKWKGSVSRFEKMLDRAVLWLACRHHIPELHIKHANEVIRGETDGPDDKLFKTFKKQFPAFDLVERSVWEWPDNINDWRHEKAREVLLWAEFHMQHATWPREDYRELLELVTVYLGGVVKRMQHDKVVCVDVYIRKPGALHRARFMASCLYLLKICMFHMQFDTALKNIQDAEILGEYVALLHAPYFLKTPLAASAPRLDRDFFNDVASYKQCFDPNSRQNIMINAIQESIRNHLWYLTGELVVLALFDDELSQIERQEMASKLLTYPRTIAIPPGKPLFPVDMMTGNVAPGLRAFVNEKSWLLFNILGTNGPWLMADVTQWKEDNEYVFMFNCVRDLKVTNDCAERCIKDITEYANAAKDSKYREDILMVATDHRGVLQDLRKDALQNNTLTTQ